MNRLLILFGVWTLVLVPYICMAGPTAVPLEPVYEFSSLVEGEVVDHAFIIRNTGDTPLNITNVLPP